MENCFRFLINVDQCLNMSAFDIFFYKMSSQHRFRNHNVQLFGNAAGSTLRDAVRGIRGYLDKYPYHVGDFQIIVAMRSPWLSQPEQWEQTVLYRLLHLSNRLKEERIFVNSRESGEKALNLVMLYDADFSVDLPELGNYFSDERFQGDCRRMLALANIGGREATVEEVVGKLDIYEAQENHDARVAACLRRYVATVDRSISFVQESQLAEGEENALFSGFSGFVREELTNFQVLESFIDRNNRRQNMLSLLRLVEFINMSVEMPAGRETAVEPLAQRCLRNWKKVWEDRELESRYAKMLRSYRARLSQASLELERPKFQTGENGVLPERIDPGPEDISHSASATTQEKAQTGDLIAMLDHFLRTRLSNNGLSRWESTYSTLQTTITEMEYQLESYAADLGRQYAAVLDQRKVDTMPWRTGIFVADGDLEKDIHQLEHDRDTVFRELQNRHIAPDLSYTDEVNIENSLEQANTAVRFHLQCMRYITRGAFLLFALACFAGIMLHYTVLQPYVFSAGSSLLNYGLYAGIVMLVFLVAWGIPYAHFKDCTKQAIGTLKDAINRYVPQYAKKKADFKNYVNLLNRLDYIDRYHRLLTRTERTTRRLSQGYLWHKIQLDAHLKKMQQFQGLIETVPQEEDPGAPAQLPTVRGGSVQDVIDSPIYWP